MATPTTLPATFVAGNVLTAAQMNNLRGAFRVLQVVSTAKTDTFTTTSTSFTDVTGLSVSITPSATSSTILVLATITGANQGGVNDFDLQLVRGSTAIAIGDAAGSRVRATWRLNVGNTGWNGSAAMVFLDSPATTSATTYKIQGKATSSGTVYINRSQTDSDSSAFVRTPSTITVMEISA